MDGVEPRSIHMSESRISLTWEESTPQRKSVCWGVWSEDAGGGKSRAFSYESNEFVK